MAVRMDSIVKIILAKRIEVVNFIDTLIEVEKLLSVFLNSKI